MVLFGDPSASMPSGEPCGEPSGRTSSQQNRDRNIPDARGAYAERPPGNPAVLLLDLKMPKIDGLEVLRQVKSDPALKTIPVVMLTSSREEGDVLRSYELGVNAYVVKPVAFADFMDAVRQLGGFWALINEPPRAGSVR